MLADTTALVLFQTLIKLFFLSVIGFVAVRLRILPVTVIEKLSKGVITVTLPSLIIATLGANLDSSMLGTLGLGVAAALAMNCVGFAFALFSRSLLLQPGEPSRNLFLSLSSMQNAGYLPIPLVAAILPEQLRAQGLLLVFVYVMSMGSLFWSLGVWLITDGSTQDWRVTAKNIANPPILSLFLGFIFFIPSIKAGFNSLPLLLPALSFIGNLTIPLALIVLGGSLGTGIAIRGKGVSIIALSTALKLFVTPVVAILAVKILGLERVFGLVLIIEAAMPAALNHIVVARSYGGNFPLTARTLFVQYSLSVLTVPLFLYLYARI